jgi:hypothetical protein
MMTNSFTQPSTVSSRRRPWTWLIPVGVCLLASGVFSNLELEYRFGTSTITDAQFAFFERAYIPMLIGGLLMILIGSVTWARLANLRNLVVSGLVVGSGTLVIAKFTPFNIHGWTGSLMFVFATALLIASLFLTIAIFRYTTSALRSKKDRFRE